MSSDFEDKIVIKKEEEKGFFDEYKPITYLVSVSITIINKILSALMTSLSYWEKPHSVSEEKVAVIKKIWKVSTPTHSSKPKKSLKGPKLTLSS